MKNTQNIPQSDIDALIARTDSMLAEEGVHYTTVQLLDTRSDQIADELRYCAENDDDSCCFKVPSGSEQMIPIEIVQWYARKNRIRF